MTDAPPLLTPVSDPRRALDRLETALGGPAEPSEEDLQALLLDLPEDGQTLGDVFELAIGLAIRRGPSPSAEETVPLPRLLRAANLAARTGRLPLAPWHRLHRRLEELEGEIRALGAWREDAPLWWRASPLEDAETDRLLSPWKRVSATLTERLDALAAPDLATSWSQPGFMVLPQLIPTELLTRIHRELTAAHDAGLLDLEAAGVGSYGRISARRTDTVRYTGGREPELLARAPTVAALVQALLAELAPRLEQALGQDLHPPQTAMLARYRGPGRGFDPHLDNPGGEQDNGRTLTLVLYLNPPEAAPAGGEIALWAEGGKTTEPPSKVIPAHGGTAALFASRRVPHQVRPLGEGPDRWALTLWFQDRPRQPDLAWPIPRVTAAEALLAVPEPPLPEGTILCHRLEEDGPEAGQFVALSPPAPGTPPPRLGLVATVYRAGEPLLAWCRHHLEAGFDHLVLVFDHGDEPEERALLERLQETFPPGRLTLWTGADTARRWRDLPESPHRDELLELAPRQGAAYAVAARQALNASLALEAARTDALGGAPLTWLAHLDGDELLVPRGRARGGETLPDLFAAAAAAGVDHLRFLPDELLSPGEHEESCRFKVNPSLATAHLGRRGWARLVEHLEMAPEDPRPYFRAHRNGKSAVRVDRALGAAGVHGWHLAPHGEAEARRWTLAGPTVLHLHLPTFTGFRAKYEAMAEARGGSEDDERPFVPSALEEAAVGLILELRKKGASEDERRSALRELYERTTTFSPEEVTLLEEAGLLWTPEPAVLSGTLPASTAEPPREKIEP